MLGLLLLHMRFRFKMPGKLKNDGKQKKNHEISYIWLANFPIYSHCYFGCCFDEIVLQHANEKKNIQPTWIDYKNNQQQKQTDAHDESIVHHQHMLKG